MKISKNVLMAICNYCCMQVIPPGTNYTNERWMVDVNTVCPL